MYNCHTLIGAVADPVETLIESGMEDRRCNNDVKGTIKVAAGEIIDVILYAILLSGIATPITVSLIAAGSKFHK